MQVFLTVSLSNSSLMMTEKTQNV